jgi:hypothetical protein
MNRSAVWLMVLAAGFAFGVIRLFDLQFSSGDAYRAYSSLRADPAGAKALYESLASTGKLEVWRNFQPLEYAPLDDATILLLGLRPAISDHDIRQIERLAGRGNRVVIALAEDEDYEQKPDAPLLLRWQVKLPSRENLIERRVGKGSVAVAPRGDIFTNGGLARGADVETILRALGPGTRVVFDEAHLGMTESGSIVGLARRYRLEGFAAGLALCAALFLWRSTSAFPPPRVQAVAGSIAGRTSASGLAGLLRQNVPPTKLAATAWELWLKSSPASAPASRKREAEAALRGARDPLAALAGAQRALESKGRNDTRATENRA